MKKSFYFFLAAFALAGCTASLEEAPVQPRKASLTFTGGFASNETKTAFTEAQNGVYPLVWSAGDAIGIFSLDMTQTANVNIKANLLRSSAGQPNGVFIPVDEIIDATEETPSQTISIEYPESGSERFFIYYPYQSKTDINVDDACVHGTLTASQQQDKAGDKQIGKNGFSWAVAQVGADHQVKFSLQHALAYVRVIVKTSDFQNACLHSVQIYDQNQKAALSGDYLFNPLDGTFSIGGRTFPEAKVTVQNDDFAAASSEQELYLTVLPGDYSAASLKAVVTFLQQDGTSVTIPVDCKNLGQTPAGSMTTLTLTVNKASNTFAWYETEEPRDLVGGWAYGPQNTYFVECKEKGQGPTDITIDVKARGDFSKVREPKYYGWLCACEMSTRKLMQFTDGTAAFESVPTHAIGNDYKVTVQCLDQEATGRWAVLGIYDADFNLLWAFMFMRYLTADPPKDVTYPGTDIVLLDRNLGASFSYAYGESVKKLENSWAYFQWGRPSPFMWSNSGLSHYTQQFVTESTSFEYAINHPTTIFAPASGTNPETGDNWNAAGKWYVGDEVKGLWGAVSENGNTPDNSLVGHKTVYDPCPKGYRVPDTKVITTVAANGLWWELAKGQTGQDASRVVATNPFGDASVLAYPLGDGKYDYWAYSGAHWTSNASWGNRTSSNSNHGYLYWANSNASAGRAILLEGCYFSKGWSTDVTATQAMAFGVRCQKDAQGR